ncbi:GTP-binding protein [Archaeoglobales archaeon]|nr:MAG: GTP-binding protein [Archaeoglobales archaeon]
MFEPRKLPTVLYAEELLDKAFRRASKVGGRNRKEKAINKLATISNTLSDYFDKIIKSHPSYDSLPEFYRETIDVVVGIGKIKKSLAALKWANEMSQKIITRSIKKIKGGKDIDETLKATYGRIASIVSQIDEELRFLNEAKQKMREIPVFKDLPTVVVAGYPNVGKSSFVAKISSVKPEIAVYPFTTKKIFVGFVDINGVKLQVVDTPGLLDRPIHKRNKIEKRAILCLKYLADCILFIIDPTETCGYSLQSQMSLLNEIRREFKVKIIPAYSKADMHNKKDLPAFSSISGEGISDVLEMVKKEVTAKKKSKRELSENLIQQHSDCS